VPVIDFQYMRQRAGVGPTGEILDIISSWTPEKKQEALEAIAEVEEQALQDMQVWVHKNITGAHGPHAPMNPQLLFPFSMPL